MSGKGGRRASTRHVVVLCTLVVSIAIVLMASVFNPSPHTGGDNAGYLSLAYSLLERGEYLDLHDPLEPPHTKYPPVYAAVLAGAMLLGARAWTTFKALSGAFTVLALVLVFLWVNQRRGPFMATGVALLVGLSDAYLWSSHWVLSDPLFVALTLLCLWALDHLEHGADPAETAAAPDPVREAENEADPSDGAVGEHPGPRVGQSDPSIPRWSLAPGFWLALGWGAAVLAYFTRSAGLPLVVAVLAWVALRRRWRALAVMGAVFAIPAALWWLRGAGFGASYLSEFWLIDPYRPDLGRADVGDLLSRLYGNAATYLGTYVPGGLTGLRGRPVTIFGWLLTGLVAVGWWWRVRARVTPAELFAPMYLGLVFLWPEVWSGDRFALPLYPFFLFYAAEALTRIAGPRRPTLRLALGVVGFLAVAAPAGGVWWDASVRASICRSAVRQAGPFACYGDSVLEFERAAVWTGLHLPSGSSVLTRKPRLFYVLNGIKGQAYPLTREPSEFLAVAERTSSRYVLLDRLDNLGAYYPSRVVELRPGRFCAITGWGPSGGVRTELLGIASAEDERAGTVSESEATVVVDLRICPADVVVPARVESAPPYSSASVPLLAGLDR